MKKIFYSLMTVAALLTAASCQKEFTNSPDPALGGKPVVTTFSVDLGVATKASASTALDNGTTVNKLYVAAFGKEDGKLVSTSLVDNNAVSATGPTTQVKLTLSKGQAYDIVFFWMYDGAYTVTFSDGPTATFAYKTSGLKANDPQMDAFYTKVSVASASTTTESVTLKRPFAQINVLSSNVPDGQTTFKSTMTVKAAPTTFDLFNGAVGTETRDLTFAENAISEAAFGKYAQNYTWIGMNFVLPTSGGTVNLTFQESGMPAALNLNGITVKKNGRTNLIGAIYDLDATITYNVTVDPVFDDPENEASLDDEETNITVAGATTYDENNPLVIDASNGLTPASVTLTVNGGDNFNDIETGANGSVIEAETSNDQVATAEVDKANNAVKITPVGNGDAVITVKTPRYTKAGYTAGSIDIPVRVTGIATPAVDPTLSVTGFPTAKVSAPFTVTLTNDSDGELTISVDPKDAATVEAGTTEGVYTVTPAEFEEDTEVTVTFATAATAAYNAGELVKTFTIKGSGGGDTPTPTTIADIKAGIGTDTNEGDAFEAFFSDVIVTYVNGNNAYIEDSTGGLLVYLNGHGLTAGTTLSGSATLKGKAYNGLQEVTTFTKGEDFTATEGATIPVTTVTVAELKANFAQYESRRIKLEGVTNETAIKANKTSINISQGEVKYVIRTQAELTTEIPANSTFDVVGYPATFKTDTQFNVWLYEDFTVQPGGEVESSISVADMEVQVGKTKTVQATVTPSNAVVAYTSSSNKISIDGNKITGVSEGTATVTATIAAVEGSYTGSSTTFTVTVVAASGDENTATLTNAEIVAALSAGSSSSNTYGDLSIDSDSGVWTGNMNTSNAITFVQIRNKSNARLVSPTFSKNIEKVELTVSKGSGDKIMARKFFALAANSDLSVFGGNYNANDTSSSWEALTKYGDASSTESTDAEQTVTIEFTGDTKNFMLVTYNGAAYINEITVYFK